MENMGNKSTKPQSELKQLEIEIAKLEADIARREEAINKRINALSTRSWEGNEEDKFNTVKKMLQDDKDILQQWKNVLRTLRMENKEEQLLTRQKIISFEIKQLQQKFFNLTQELEDLNSSNNFFESKEGKEEEDSNFHKTQELKQKYMRGLERNLIEIKNKIIQLEKTLTDITLSDYPYESKDNPLFCLNSVDSMENLPSLPESEKKEKSLLLNLPPEMRYKIYDQLAPTLQDLKNLAGLFQVSKQISEEVKDFIQHKEGNVIFLQLPLEIREMIYDELAPTLQDLENLVRLSTLNKKMHRDVTNYIQRRIEKASVEELIEFALKHPTCARLVLGNSEASRKILAHEDAERILIEMGSKFSQPEYANHANITDLISDKLNILYETIPGKNWEEEFEQWDSDPESGNNGFSFSP